MKEILDDDNNQLLTEQIGHQPRVLVDVVHSIKDVVTNRTSSVGKYANVRSTIISACCGARVCH